MAKFKSIENEEQLFTADLELDDLVNLAINKTKKTEPSKDKSNDKVDKK